jgi:hypothetical protein
VASVLAPDTERSLPSQRRATSAAALAIRDQSTDGLRFGKRRSSNVRFSRNSSVCHTTGGTASTER